MSLHYEIINPSDHMPVRAILHSIESSQMHWHEHIEYLMVLEGSLLVRIDETESLLQKGDIVRINSSYIHSTSKTHEPNLLLALQVDPSFYTTIYESVNALHFHLNSALDIEPASDRYDWVRYYIAQIVWEMVQGAHTMRPKIGSLLFQLSEHLLLNFECIKSEDAKGNITNEDALRLKRIVEYVNQNLHQKITLGDIGKQEHLSYHYLSHFIRNKLGCTFQEYLSNTRLNRATQLLSDSSISIASVAESVGFASPIAFTRTFKQKYGMSPSDFRKQRTDSAYEWILNREKEPNSASPDITGSSDSTNQSRTYLDIDRQAALKTLFAYLEMEPAGTPQPPRASIQTHSLVVDASAAQGTPLIPYWAKLTSFTRASEGLREGWRKQLGRLQHDIGFEYIRCHGIFSDDMMVVQKDATGSLVFNWTYLDSLLDHLLQAGLKPFVELGFMPTPLRRSDDTSLWWRANISPPREMSEWVLLVDAFVRHCANRYGLAEVETWYFEVWNEPEFENVFWAGTQQEYFDFYRHTALAIKSISPRLRVGGPSIAHQALADSSWLEDFLCTCRKDHTPVDFVSIHIYPEYYPRKPDTLALLAGVEQLSAIDQETLTRLLQVARIYYGRNHTRETLESARAKIVSAYGEPLALHVTEWNASAFSRNLIHDTAFASAFIIHNVLSCVGLADSLGYWTFTDINEEAPLPPEPFHGNFGLMNKDGIRKAAYYAYMLLSQLGDEVLAQDEGSIVTRRGQDIQILACNYAYFNDAFLKGDVSALTQKSRYRVFEDKGEQVLDITVNGISGRYRIVRYQLNREHGSSFDQWVNMGAPMQPTAEEIAYLDAISQPKITTEETALDGTYHAQMSIPAHGAELIVLKHMV